MLSKDIINLVVKSCDRNLRKAINMLQTIYVSGDNIDKIPLSDLEMKVNDVRDGMMSKCKYDWYRND